MVAPASLWIRCMRDVMSRAVPPPGGLATCIRLPSTSMRSLSPISPEPFRELAPPIPSSQIDRLGASWVTRARLHLGGLSVLGRISERLGHHIVSGCLNGVGQPLLDRDVEVDRYRRAAAATAAACTGRADSAKGSSISDSTPTQRTTAKPAARSVTYLSGAVLPTPGSPRSTITALRPPRT